MTVITPLYAMVNRIGQLVVQNEKNPSAETHFELLRMIDRLKLEVETPTETVLRLIYQVCCFGEAGYNRRTDWP